MNYFKEHGEVGLLLIVIVTAILLASSMLFTPLSVGQKILMVFSLIFFVVSFGWIIFKADFRFFARYKGQIGLGLLVIYAILLALATISEELELDWFTWL